ncbi:hypothetical protein GOEFS_119_00150 [Gordonia effusa NBRC 100432]|uniref:NlpC/P60 domain-containing protein n=1 Tax=Gordonia effusa NBRC 100432 TaxID=1077974 RepID=H0R624_9ACTN|nr:C40 family peptidase [Gordonia effusa]GAB20525.1 hypothetical protein GOEFS_119_00150 [Gordonia effusa NBRC 100432]
MTLAPPPTRPTPSAPDTGTGTGDGDGNGRKWIAGIVALLTSIAAVLVMVPALLVVAMSGGDSAGCQTTQVADISVGSAIAGLNPKQTQIAATIVARATARKLPVSAAIAGVATGQDESGLRNLANPNVPASMNLPNDGVGQDHNSVGVFQQQPDQGWGTPAQLMDPGTAADKFFDALVAVPGWQSLAPAEAITKVQRNSAGASVYVPFIAPATKIVAALLNDPNIADLAASVPGAGNCGSSSTPGAAIDPANIPGFVKGGPVGPNIVAAAASQMGIRYSWGGGDLHGPTNGIHDPVGDQYGDYNHPGWDCSGLARYAVFVATGKVIARVSQAQSTGGMAVPNQAAAQPGDLVFFGGEGSAHHVGIYMGGGKMVNAPESGKKVSIADISGFDKPITFRRYT